MNLYGFIGPEVFLTKSGETGVVLEVRGVDYECLDQAAIDALTKRLESALKLFDENCRLYQYLFKRSNRTIPYQLYANPIVDAAIRNRVAYLESKAGALFALSVYYVLLYRTGQTSERLASAVSRFLQHPSRSFFEWRALLLDPEDGAGSGEGFGPSPGNRSAESQQLHSAGQRLSSRADFDQARSFFCFETDSHFDPRKLADARLKHDTFLDFYLPESHVECHRRHLRVDHDYVKVLTLKGPSAQATRLSSGDCSKWKPTTTS